MLERYSRIRLALAVASCALTASIASGQNGPTPSNGCGSLPGYTQLKAALTAATIAENSGLKNQMWGTIADRDGVVCAVRHRQRPDCPMAWQPCDFRAKGEHGQRIQLGFRLLQQRQRPSRRLGVIDGESLFRGSARRQPVWLTGKRSGE